MSKSFQKFIDTGDKGAKKKERIRQEKKQMRKEKNEYFEKKKLEARGQKSEAGSRKPEDTRYKGQGTRKSGAGGGRSEARSQRSEDSRYKDTGRKNSEARSQNSEDRRYKAQDSRNKEAGKKNFRNQRSEEKRPAAGSKPAASSHFSGNKSVIRNPQSANTKSANSSIRPSANIQKATPNKRQPETQNPKPGTASVMPLNKFIAHAGVCSRRDAAEMVKIGKVVVNGQVIKEPGTKVSQQDEIKVNGKKISVRRNLVYILLNKPKDYITTTEDPEGRKTVLDIVRNATTERVYPIGRLDRNTTGVLLLTNDGELAQKLAHPSYEVKKIYEVKLDKPLTKTDFDTLINGIKLEDGFVQPDALAYADSKDKTVIGIEIHSGRNRIVRRMFEHLGYDVRNLDRVMYANLTKKNVERGKWRLLTEKEVRLLKYLNASYTRK